MGICASSNIPTTAKEGGNMMMMVRKLSQSTAKVIHLDGSHQEFQEPIKVGEVLSQNPPGWFLCCSESMLLNSPPPRMPETEELQPGRIYFLLPISTPPLSLPDLCILAIIATSRVPIHHVSPDADLRFSRTSLKKETNPLL